MSLRVDVRKRLGAFELDASFQADSGITALFGPSGAGKTTILRCVAGLEQPDAGVIQAGDRTFFDKTSGINLPARERRVGYVFQEYALFPHLTVEQNVGFGISSNGAHSMKRIAELLEMVGLGGFHDRNPTELSGGQQQRVAIARALATDPEVLLLDEPFSAVDLRLRRTLRNQLLALHRQVGIPMLLVTHDTAEVRHLADTLILVDGGKILGAYTSDDLANPDPRSALAEFFAA